MLALAHIRQDPLAITFNHGLVVFADTIVELREKGTLLHLFTTHSNLLRKLEDCSLVGIEKKHPPPSRKVGVNRIPHPLR